MQCRIAHCRCVIDAVLLVTASLALHAQSEYGNRTSTTALSIGLAFAAGASVSVEAPESWKTDPLFAWRLGVDASYPMTPAIAASLGVGIDSRAIEFHWHNDRAMWEQRRVDYLYVAPGLQFSAFYLGLNVGFPIAGIRHWQSSADAGERSVDLETDADHLLFMVEPRLGAVIPVLEQEIGWLGLTLQAGYNINDMSESPEFTPGSVAASTTSTQTTSIHFGVTWQFGVPGTGQK